jgi:hypothetical protein
VSTFSGPDKIGEWTTTQLVKFIRDLLQNAPPDFLPLLKAEEVEVFKQLTIRDKVAVTREAAFREIGKPGQPTFSNGWVNFAGGWRPAGFWRSPFHMVYLRGLIKSGTVGQAAYTLPPAFRPSEPESFPVISNAALGRVSVFTDGTVVPETPSSNTWVSLSGIVFRAS